MRLRLKGTDWIVAPKITRSQAIYHATGKRMRELLVTPDKVTGLAQKNAATG